MVTPDAKREAVAHVVAVHGVSQRRACEVLAVDRSSIGALRRALRGNNQMGGMPLHFPPPRSSFR